MNTKLRLIVSLFLLVWISLPCQLDAALIIDVSGNDLYVQSDQNATAGFQGCEETKLREAPAYVFNLYRNDIPNTKNTQCDVNSNWRIQQQKFGEQNETVVFENLPPGTYKVVGFYGSAEGCSISEGQQAIVYHKEAAAFVTLESSLSPSALENLNDIQSIAFKTYPNPASDIVSIELTEGMLMAPVSVSVFDLLGQQVINQNPGSTNGDCAYTCQLDVSKLPAGTFVITIQDNDGQMLHQEKLIIIRD